MYKLEEYEGEPARKQCARPIPFGPAIVNPAIERLEVWGTRFDDPGPDYCEFRLFDAAGVLIATHRIGGY